MYSGLLDLAHQKGLQRIHVEVVQYPSKENGSEAICKAHVESKTGDSYIEFGDANPKNVNPKIAAHILRMAATRAKARALRDFTNIGMTCLEELGEIFDEVLEGDPGKKSRRPVPSVKREPPALVTSISGNRQEATNDTARKPTTPLRSDDFHDGPKPSSAQMRAIENLARRRSISTDNLHDLCEQNFGTSLRNINSSEASRFIQLLQQSA